MNAVLCTKASEENGRRLLRLLEAVIPANELEVLETIDDLSRRLRQPAQDFSMAVLMASNKEELWGIISIRHLLYRMRFILIVPDREEDTLTRGYALRPRYLTCIDEDFNAVAAFIDKTRRKIRANGGSAESCQQSPQPSAEDALPVGKISPAGMISRSNAGTAASHGRGNRAKGKAGTLPGGDHA